VGTADYLVALSAGVVSALWLPVLLFGLACLVSFATGTSWGTMSILLPNVVGLAAAVGATHPIGAFGMVLVCIGAVLEGSIFGDHCSPISDTTVLSSVATASDHIDHVRTQAPYALVTAVLAVLAGYLPTLAWDAWSLPLALITAFGAWAALLWLLGRPPA
jgi:Na+/H+ antiporter NhaC